MQHNRASCRKTRQDFRITVNSNIGTQSAMALHLKLGRGLSCEVAK